MANLKFNNLYLYLFSILILTIIIGCQNQVSFMTSEIDGQRDEPQSVAIELQLPAKDLRGVWVQASALSSAAEIDRTLALVEEIGFNTIFINTTTYGKAFYRSELLLPGDSVSDDFDPLAYVLTEADKRNIDVHAWVVVGLMDNEDKKQAQILKDNPTWALLDDEGQPSVWLDYAQPKVRDFIEDVAVEIATSYPVAGIHFDYIRYPEWGWWPNLPKNVARRDTLNQMMARIHQRLENEAPKVQFSAAVFYNQDVASDVLQDWPLWLAEDSVDFVVPMAYAGEGEEEYTWLNNTIESWENTLPPKDYQQIVPGISVAVFDFDIPYDTGVPKQADTIMREIQLLNHHNYQRMVLFDLGLLSNDTLKQLAQ